MIDRFIFRNISPKTRDLQWMALAHSSNASKAECKKCVSINFLKKFKFKLKELEDFVFVHVEKYICLTTWGDRCQGG